MAGIAATARTRAGSANCAAIPVHEGTKAHEVHETPYLKDFVFFVGFVSS